MNEFVVAVDVQSERPRTPDELMAAIQAGRATIVSARRNEATAPSLLQKAANFASSAARHVAAGMPRATQEEIDRRFAICQQCEHFDGKACRQCGCPVVREKQFISKLSWANEKCPAGKWGPENRDGPA